MDEQTWAALLGGICKARHIHARTLRGFHAPPEVHVCFYQKAHIRTFMAVCSGQKLATTRMSTAR